ncbi:sigma-70 family RNA polymerase sigma factor [Lentilactobacillus kisonensis]|nr:sigma-70 family RNA polymerase sigma factor [Lentilactobacillus kisonensis]
MTNKQDVNKLRAEAFAFLQAGDHEKVVYGALKKLHINRSNPFYEDMVQEGMIAFVEKYMKAACLEKGPENLLVYIYQGVYWKLLDYLRKQLTVNQHVQGLAGDKDDPLAELPDLKQTVADYELNAFSSELRRELTPNEAQYLTLALDYGYNLTEIAKPCNVSRQTVHNWRKGIQRKVAKLIEK